MRGWRSGVEGGDTETRAQHNTRAAQKRGGHVKTQHHGERETQAEGPPVIGGIAAAPTC
jgi:hypothetical protein